MAPFLRFVYLLAAPVAALGAPAQPTAPPRPLTLPEALALNLAADPVIRSAQAQLAGVAFRPAEARLAAAPRLVAQAQTFYATSNQIRGAFFPNNGSTPSVEGGYRPNGANGQSANGSPLTWSSFGTLLADGPIATFGKTRAAVAAAQSAQDRQQAAVDNTIFRQQVETAAAYVAVLNADAERRVWAGQAQRLAALRRAVLARTRSGLRPGADSSLVDANYARVVLRAQQAQLRAQTERLRLAERIGLRAPDFAVGSAAFVHDAPAQLPGALTPDSLLLAAHPAARLRQADLDLALAGTEVFRRARWPSLRGVAALWTRGSGIGQGEYESLSYNTNLGAGLRPRAFNSMVGVALAWSLNDVLHLHHAEQGARLEADARRDDAQTTGRALRRAYATAALDGSTSQQQQQQATAQQQAARATYARFLARYNNGLADVADLNQAVDVLQTAELYRQQARYQGWQSLLNQAAATGRLPDFLLALRG